MVVNICEPVVGPGTELYRTRLVVEREISNVDVARGCEDSARFPMNMSVMSQHDANFLEVRGQFLRTNQRHMIDKRDHVKQISVRSFFLIFLYLFFAFR